MMKLTAHRASKSSPPIAQTTRKIIVALEDIKMGRSEEEIGEISLVLDGYVGK